jgi:hypothetical protein
MYPPDLEVRDELVDMPEVLSRGGSAIVGPLGDYLAGPLFGSEGIIAADLDLRQVVEGRYDFDAVGHYARNDVFRLVVNTRAMTPVEIVPGARPDSPPDSPEESHHRAGVSHADRTAGEEHGATSAAVRAATAAPKPGAV